MNSMYQPGGAWLLSGGEVAVSPPEPFEEKVRSA